MSKQQTIAKEISLSGVGLHTANKVNVTFKPAPVDSGINFIRVDSPAKALIKASTENLLSPSLYPRRTSIGKDGAEIQTIEHLMAVFSGLGIDNIIVEADASELPGMDGSGLLFSQELSRAGIKEQEKERKVFSVKEPIFIEHEGSSLIALPCADFKVSYTLNYNHPYLKSQFLEATINADLFQKEISGARTFCLEQEVELKREGFGHGANYENTLVVGKDGVIKNKLRFSDEFIRHKVLDLIGDLYLAGPIKAHIIAIKSGHAHNLELARKISQQDQTPSAASAGGFGYKLQAGAVMDVSTIKEILPHREPFLFVDRIIEMEYGKRALGIKNVTINDYFFKGHFPNRPVMPGVIIIEAMAQVGGVMMLAPEENRGKLAFFMAINNVKFRKPVVPGDQLFLEVVAGKMKSKTGIVHGRALVDGKVVAEADLMFAIIEN
ncbi:MAG: UDP-3-O-acyl-N-acetylglucosamine deacetylase [Candidatus Omnitrophica bacterium]|nr:UDP-3-O-acyl-N-acetylglucosamine deacetylase [Candidatus Omnitrophota bacterium]MBU1870044.1 UDP-3-O-acyl-N-acetylglucosamine deacetylase [Candidatus Omnitrophota bacterium]